ncbi:MAG: RDD family protein [Rickettsiales bacterium]|nr:RDD family protein [Rickettsiales bacterium]
MDKLGTNARSHKRVLGFFIDIFFVNFLKTFLIQIFVLSRSKIVVIQEFLDNFENLFGKVELAKLKDHHIRYIVNNSTIFDSLFYVVVIMSFTGMLYNFICTFFLNSSTFGQKILSLKVVDAKKDKKPGFVQLLIRAILVPFPLVMVFLFFVLACLFFINFHIYAPPVNWKVLLLIKLAKLTEYQYVATTILVFFIIFWYNTYYLTNRLIFTDILSLTRVIETKGRSISGKNNKDFVYFGDKFLGLIEKFNNFLIRLLRGALHYLKDKFSGFLGRKNK